jgi:hypothetical protein
MAIIADIGTVQTARVAQPHGPNPVTNDEIVAKFRALTDRVMADERAGAIE